jgi:hypothetical protein
MKITYKLLTEIAHGQDGVVKNGYVFRFDGNAICHVYDLRKIKGDGSKESEITTFTLDRADELTPHCNAVMFGKEYFSPDDEFPLLYCNLYNAYDGKPDQMWGVCCVYRLQRNGESFKTDLVQIIEIGFVKDIELWRSCTDRRDQRPFGNFTIDTEKGIYYAFTMRDKPHETRYFAFDLPALKDGKMDPVYNVNRVVLNREDIKDYFDGDYSNYLQGACFHDGKIYSTEGGCRSVYNPAAMKVIDPAKRCQIDAINLVEIGLELEPELIDFDGDTCYFCDNYGFLYTLDIEF